MGDKCKEIIFQSTHDHRQIQKLKMNKVGRKKSKNRKENVKNTEKGMGWTLHLTLGEPLSCHFN